MGPLVADAVNPRIGCSSAGCKMPTPTLPGRESQKSALVNHFLLSPHPKSYLPLQNDVPQTRIMATTRASSKAPRNLEEPQLSSPAAKPSMPLDRQLGVPSMLSEPPPPFGVITASLTHRSDRQWFGGNASQDRRTG